MANGRGNNGHHITSVYYMVAVAAAVIGGFWVVMQTQLTNLHDQNVLLRDDVIRIASERKQEISTTKTEVDRRLAAIDRDLIERRKEFFSVREFALYKSQLGTLERRLNEADGEIKSRIKSIEDTRPTASELQSVSTGLRDRIDRLDIALGHTTPGSSSK